MTVKFTRPSINIRETLDQLNKPSGIAGNAMLAADTPQEQFNLIGAGRKNLIINGGFDVWQRGTSFTPAQVYGYSADRARLSSGSTVNITKESATIEGNVVNTLKHSITSTSVGWDTRYDQRIEEFDYFKNKTFTLSFWVKSSRTHALSSSQIYFGGGGINTLDLYADYNMGDVTPTWTKKVITFSVGDLSTATGTYVDLVIGITSDGAAIDIEYAQMQLEIGKVATPFEHRSFSEELALCQRYYEKSFNYDDAPANGSSATTFSTNAGRDFCDVAIWAKHSTINFNVEKRINPSITRYGNSSGYWGYLSVGTAAPASDSAYAFHQNLLASSSSKKSVSANNQVSGQPLWGIIGHWTADAEL